LTLDWQFSSRTLLWQNSNPEDYSRASEERLDGFQKDLNSLRRLAEVVTWLQNRIFLQEATLRLMAGASPARTQQLLDKSSSSQTIRTRSLMCREREVYSGEREQAVALMMACRHLPPQLLSSPGERAGMLTEAAVMLERLGDLSKLEECKSLMAKLSSNCSKMLTLK